MNNTIHYWFCLSVTLLLGVLISQSTDAQTFDAERTLHIFTDGTDGGYPLAGLLGGANGEFYGTATFGGASDFGVVFKVDENGNERVLYSFKNGSDGFRPYGGLISDASGNLYGTTWGGGRLGGGTVFKLSTSGAETVLYSFTGGADGGAPQAALLRDAAGNLYGTTLVGGAHNKGVAFKLEPNGKESVLHSFGGYPTDGASPFAALILDAKGNMYGTTFEGGAGNCKGGRIPPKVVGCGTIFKLDATGKETVLHSFTGGADGGGPAAGLTLHNGNLYGTTVQGGRGNGTVFELAHSPTGGWSEHVLHSFAGTGDGQLPEGGLIFDGSGNIYGTTSAGGTFGGECPNYGCGFVFELTPTSTGWNEKLLYGFTGGADGGAPYAGVIFDTKGHLLGTTFYGGDAACQWCGVVFEISLK